MDAQKQPRALLTGAGGFTGQAMTRFLASKGVEVHSIGAHAAPAFHAPSSTAPQAHTHTQLDITSASQIASALQAIQPDYIFHLAGVVRSPDPQDFYRVNTAFAVALLTALETVAAPSTTSPRVLMVGTAAEVGQPRPDQLPIREDMPPNPLEHYGISKLAQTHAARAAHLRTGLHVVVARPSNMIGVGMPQHFVVQSFATQIAAMMRSAAASGRANEATNEAVLRTGNLSSARDFMSVEAACEAFWQLANTPEAAGEVVNVCSGVATPIANIVQILIRQAQQQCPQLHIRVETDPALMRPVDVPVHYGSTEKFHALTQSSSATDSVTDSVTDATTSLEAALEAILRAS
jgi:GDP-4-dehydro-6-deoxy-D-mannose reductase